MKKKRIIVAVAVLVLFAVFSCIKYLYNNLVYGKFEESTDLNFGRTQVQALKLKNGNILILGGDDNNTVEIFNPKTKLFELKKGVRIKKYPLFNAVALDDDNIFIIDRWGEETKLYNPVSDTLENGPSSNFDGMCTSLLKLKNGHVLILKIVTAKKTKSGYSIILEVYDPVSKKINKVVNAPEVRKMSNDPTLMLLNNGDILLGNGIELFVYNQGKNTFNRVVLNELESYTDIQHKYSHNTNFLQLKDDTYVVYFRNSAKNRFYMYFYQVKNNKANLIKKYVSKDRLPSSTVTPIGGEYILFTGIMAGRPGLTLRFTNRVLIYDFKSNTIKKINKLNFNKVQHTVIEYDNCKYLLVGGESQKRMLESTVENKTEIFTCGYALKKSVRGAK